MNTLPVSASDIANARLPQAYATAKHALLECCRVDECQQWANKMHALASYAKQAHDESLRRMAMRIQARAIQRCGELLKEVPAQSGKRTDLTIAGPPTRAQAARAAGLSRGQARSALQVAQVPKAEFERQVESTNPPTVTRLALKGAGRTTHPENLRRSLRALKHFKSFVDYTQSAQPQVVARSMSPQQMRSARMQVAMIERWLEEFTVAMVEHLSVRAIK